jgi:hypothetical protein
MARLECGIVNDLKPLELGRRIGAIVVLSLAFAGLAGVGGDWLQWLMFGAIGVLTLIVVLEQRRYPDTAPDRRQAGLLLALLTFLAITSFFD